MIPSHERQRLYRHQMEIERRKNTEAIVVELYQSWNADKMSGPISCTDYCADPVAVNHYMNEVGINVRIHRIRTGRYAPHTNLPGLNHSTYELTYTAISTSGPNHRAIPNPLTLSVYHDD